MVRQRSIDNLILPTRQTSIFDVSFRTIKLTLSSKREFTQNGNILVKSFLKINSLIHTKLPNEIRKYFIKVLVSSFCPFYCHTANPYFSLIRRITSS